MKPDPNTKKMTSGSQNEKWRFDVLAAKFCELKLKDILPLFYVSTGNRLWEQWPNKKLRENEKIASKWGSDSTATVFEGRKLRENEASGMTQRTMAEKIKNPKVCQWKLYEVKEFRRLEKFRETNESGGKLGTGKSENGSPKNLRETMVWTAGYDLIG